MMEVQAMAPIASMVIRGEAREAVVQALTKAFA